MGTKEKKKKRMRKSHVYRQEYEAAVRYLFRPMFLILAWIKLVKGDPTVLIQKKTDKTTL
jgi:hypothetical protein